MQFAKQITVFALLAMSAGALLLGESQTKVALAQTGAPEAQSVKSKDAPADPYDRVAQFWFYQRMGKRGWERGQEIYLMNCWICHNDYTIRADPRAAPTLRNLYKRPKLMSGLPVNDENVTTQIKRGSARMPAYSAALNETDLADLLLYIREKCCWDEMNPPANPNYRAGK